jgi:hypothetical protein
MRVSAPGRSGVAGADLHAAAAVGENPAVTPPAELDVEARVRELVEARRPVLAELERSRRRR